MRIFTAIFLTLCILVQTFSSSLIQVGFWLNQSYIAENLCVNKDKPMMHCNGKCYLTKQLKEQQQQKQQAPDAKAPTFDIIPFFVPKLFGIEQTVIFSKIQYFIQDECLIYGFHRAIFHPPLV